MTTQYKGYNLEVSFEDNEVFWSAAAPNGTIVDEGFAQKDAWLESDIVFEMKRVIDEIEEESE